MRAKTRHALDTLPDDVRLAAEQARQLRAHADAEAERARQATRQAIGALTKLGVPNRAAGKLLGLSAQRVHQILRAT